MTKDTSWFCLFRGLVWLAVWGGLVLPGGSWLALFGTHPHGLGRAAYRLRIPLGVSCIEALLPAQGGESPEGQAIWGVGESRPLSLALSLKGPSWSFPFLLSSCSPERDPHPFPDSCPPLGAVTGSVPSLITRKSVKDLRHQTCYFPAPS